MKTMTVLTLIAGLTLGRAGMAAAQQSGVARNYERQVPAALLAQAKVSEDSARVLALGTVSGGTVEAVELIREHGQLSWVWDVKVPGKRGITEVSVNAVDGKVESHAE